MNQQEESERLRAENHEVREERSQVKERLRLTLARIEEREKQRELPACGKANRKKREASQKQPRKKREAAHHLRTETRGPHTHRGVSTSGLSAVPSAAGRDERGPVERRDRFARTAGISGDPSPDFQGLVHAVPTLARGSHRLARGNAGSGAHEGSLHLCARLT
ncbi:MAG TPA: hypothetical protein VGF67_17535 [Ktedonobacteraceae bacterium]